MPRGRQDTLSVPLVSEGAFSFGPEGFRYNSVQRLSKSDLQTLLFPRRPKYACHWKPPELTTKNLKAQLAHYGLPVSGGIEILKTRLRTAFSEGKLDTVPEEVQVKEQELKDKWEQLAKPKRTKKRAYAQLGTDEEKADYDPKTFLEEFRTSGRQLVVLENLGSRSLERVRQAAVELGLHARPVDVNENLDSASPNKVLVVGVDWPQVCRKVMELVEGARKAKVAEQRSLKRAVAEGSAKTLEAQHPTDWGEHHLLGTWEVFCPAISDQWEECENLNFTLFRSRWDRFLNGELNLGVLEGILGLDSVVSSKNPCVKYRWAGRETGENEILPGDNIGELRFYGRGTRIKGTIGIPFIGRKSVHFDAFKVSEQPRTGVVSWRDFSEDRFFQEQEARWNSCAATFRDSDSEADIVGPYGDMLDF